jgi:hypothetical protein
MSFCLPLTNPGSPETQRSVCVCVCVHPSLSKVRLGEFRTLKQILPSAFLQKGGAGGNPELLRGQWRGAGKGLAHWQPQLLESHTKSSIRVTGHSSQNSLPCSHIPYVPRSHRTETLHLAPGKPLRPLTQCWVQERMLLLPCGVVRVQVLQAASESS